MKGFIGAKALHAVPVQGIDAMPGQALDRHLDKGGFADTRLARDEDELPFAGEHSLRHAVQGRQRRSASNPPTNGSRVLDPLPVRCDDPRVHPAPVLSPAVEGSAMILWRRCLLRFRRPLSRTR